MGKAGGIAALVGGAMSVGSALTMIYEDWKEQRLTKQMRRNREMILDHEDLLFEQMIQNNKDLLERILKKTEG